jgi:hypothetical protein
MGKSGPKLSDAKANKMRAAIRAEIKKNKDLQAAVTNLVKSSKSKDKKTALVNAISKVIVRNPLLQNAAKAIFNKMK